jgi:predicted transposase/invertase (TIGR01784 family)
MIAEANVDVIDKAVNVIKDMSEDTRIREIARHREKMLHDEASLMKGAMEKGLRQGLRRGREEGRNQEREKLRFNMLRLGMSAEDIDRILNG